MLLDVVIEWVHARTAPSFLLAASVVALFFVIVFPV